MGLLNGRIAVITGAANGIGREHARLFGHEGAHVVVNDVGSEDAQRVADEIVAAGGAAVASAESVVSPDGARRIVDTAVEAFGDLHVVVNNAGILRDRTLVSMSEHEFDEVIDVHLKGTFNVTQFSGRIPRRRRPAGRLRAPQPRRDTRLRWILVRDGEGDD
jgi:NAD(P)-dependent dehydrogenase (short-subunit alcohol dehydrogenase family)